MEFPIKKRITYIFIKNFIFFWFSNKNSIKKLLMTVIRIILQPRLQELELQEPWGLQGVFQCLQEPVVLWALLLLNPINHNPQNFPVSMMNLFNK